MHYICNLALQAYPTHRGFGSEMITWNLNYNYVTYDSKYHYCTLFYGWNETQSLGTVASCNGP